MDTSLSLTNPNLGSASQSLKQQVLKRRLIYIMLVRVILFTLIIGGIITANIAWGTPERLGTPQTSFLFIFIAGLYLLNILYAVFLRATKHIKLLALVQMVLDLLS